MEKITILFKPEVENYINELVFQLYKENYFDYLENAINYKDKLIDYILDNIHLIPNKTSPLALYSLGSKYIFYKSTSRTTWYIFFEKKEQRYLITYITNNHTEVAKFIRY